MSKTLIGTAVALGVVLVVVYGWLYLPRSEKTASPEELARQALQAATAEERERAAIELAQLSGPAALEQIRRVLGESRAPQVRAVCIRALGAVRDFEAMDLLLCALEDESPLVRGRAGVAVTRMIGRDYHFRPHESAEQRAGAVKNIRRYWKAMDGSPQLESYKERLRQQEDESS